MATMTTGQTAYAIHMATAQILATSHSRLAMDAAIRAHSIAARAGSAEGLHNARDLLHIISAIPVEAL